MTIGTFAETFFLKGIKRKKCMSEQDGKVRISYKAGLNEKDPTGFKEYRVPFDKVAEMVRTAGQYSAASFRDEYRDAKHVLPGVELMILDYDDGLTVADALALFSRYIGFIATTKSHRKEKNGVVCDRFRVIIPTKSPITLGTEDYSAMMKEVIINHYGPDRLCCNIARMYYGYPGAEVFSLDGCRLFDWEPFYQSAQDYDRQRRQQQHRRSAKQPSGDRAAVEFNRYIENFMRKNFVPGARNGMLFRLARWLRDEGIDDVARVVTEQNSLSGCPLPDDEVNEVLRKALNPLKT